MKAKNIVKKNSKLCYLIIFIIEGFIIYAFMILLVGLILGVVA